MRKPLLLALIVAVAWCAAVPAFGGGIVGEKYPAFEQLFPNNRMLSGASLKTAESCVTFLKDDWKGVACFRDGVCAVFLLFPLEDAGRPEENIARKLDAIQPGLTWSKKDGQKLCQNDVCHGGLFPGGRGAFLIGNEAQKQVKNRKIQSKGMLTQTMTTAILRLGDPLDYDDGVIIWETSQMRVGVPLASSAMSYIVWNPTRQKKLRDKKALRMARDLVSVEFDPPSYVSRTARDGDLIGYGGGYQYCLIRHEDELYPYTICTSALRYTDLQEMAERLVYPEPPKTPPHAADDSKEPKEPKDDKAAPPLPPTLPSDPKIPAAPDRPSGKEVPAPVSPTHEELLKLFIDSFD